MHGVHFVNTAYCMHYSVTARVVVAAGVAIHETACAAPRRFATLRIRSGTAPDRIPALTVAHCMGAVH